MTDQTLTPTAQIESILFVASAPVPVKRLARVLGMKAADVKTHLYDLQEELLDRGLDLQWAPEGVQLTSAPESAELVETFLGLGSTTRLSPASIETLAIAAYLQPVTRPQIDQIRGVNSDGALRKLLAFGLVREIGRKDSPGRPILYGTSAEFLQYFGLGSLDELPDLPDDVDDPTDDYGWT
ncbi:MAG: SMC-Scp complex subunit ScpB [Candidatus Promineifilaceae bacterium]